MRSWKILVTMGSLLGGNYKDSAPPTERTYLHLLLMQIIWEFLGLEEDCWHCCKKEPLNLKRPGPNRFRNAVTLAMFACMGGEQVVMTAGEAKHPWKDLPAVMSFVYLIPLALYPLATLAVGANVNFAHPDLAHPYVKSANATPLSPFMIAVKGASHNGLFKALNAFFLISAYTAGYAIYS